MGALVGRDVGARVNRVGGEGGEGVGAVGADVGGDVKPSHSYCSGDRQLICSVVNAAFHSGEVFLISPARVGSFSQGMMGTLDGGSLMIRE